MRIMFDASNQPTPAMVKAFDAAAFYIGGDTPNIWTDAQIALMPNRWFLPIFTRSQPQGFDPEAEAAFVVSWLSAHRWTPGACVALDFETAVNARYVNMFDAVIVQAGWKTLLYGSLSTVLQNPQPSGGYWVADWTGVEPASTQYAAEQYASDAMTGKPYDLSVLADSTLLHDPTAGAPAPPPPAPATILENTEMDMVRPLSEQADGQYSFSVPAAATGVRFTFDNFGATDPAQLPVLRLAFWEGVNPGSAPMVDTVTLSGGATDVAFPDPVHTCGVTVTRQDSTGFPIGVSWYMS